MTPHPPTPPTPPTHPIPPAPPNSPSFPSRPSPGEVTRLLDASRRGDPSARDRLVALLYAELHRMARSHMRGERAGHTLGATGLVNETFLRLFKQPTNDAPEPPPADPDPAPTNPGPPHQHTGPLWSSRAAFFAAAAAAMRRVLVDHARARNAQKRGGRARPAHIEADALAAADSLDPADFLALDDAISRLQHVDPRAAEVVRLRFFAGQDIRSVAQLRGVSERTVKRDWEFARAWLRQTLDADPEPA